METLQAAECEEGGITPVTGLLPKLAPCWPQMEGFAYIS